MGESQAMAKIWRPVKDGNYGLHELVGIDADGAEIDMCAIDPHGIEWPIEETLPSSLRLCELVESDAPTPVPLTDDVRNTIVRELMDAQAMARHGVYMGDDERVTDIDVALAWLDAQGKDTP